MKQFIKYATLALMFVVALPNPQSEAQAINPEYAVGVSPYQTYHGGDINSISTYNGSLSLRIPLVSYPQRVPT